MSLNYRELDETDLKLALLKGSSISVGNLDIKPYKLKEVIEYGYSKYIKNLQWISVSVDDFIESVLDEDKKKFLEEQKKNLKAFDFYIKLGGEELQHSLVEALSMVFRTSDIEVLEDVIGVGFKEKGILVENDEGVLTVNQELLEELSEEEITVIHRDNFDDLVKILKFQNYLEKPEIEVANENPVDEETRMLQEHMKKMREKVEAKKKRQQQEDGESDIDISDIVSAVSSKSNSINKLNIWELTLYQLHDEYTRLELIDNYDFSIKAMMAGAEKIKLRHWSSKL